MEGFFINIRFQGDLYNHQVYGGDFYKYQVSERIFINVRFQVELYKRQGSGGTFTYTRFQHLGGIFINVRFQ